MPVFLEIPGYGLSNRIRTLLAYDFIAHRQKRGHLYVFWQNTGSCPEHYNNLFEPIPGVTLVTNKEEFQKLRKANPRAMYFRGQGQFQGIVKRRTGLNLTGALKPNGQEYQIFRQAYQKLKPLPELWSTIQAYIEANQIRDCQGLHIRRTDHVNFIIRVKGHYDNDRHFEQIIESRPKQKFYLSTDNLATQEKFLKKYPDRILVYSPIPEVESARKTTVQHAVIDLFLLAHCREIHGSFGSSFTEFAYRLWNVYSRPNNQAKSDRLPGSQSKSGNQSKSVKNNQPKGRRPRRAQYQPARRL